MDVSGDENDVEGEAGARRGAGEVGPEVGDGRALVEEDEEVADRVEGRERHEDADGPDVPHDGREAEVEAAHAEPEEHGGCDVADLGDDGDLRGLAMGMWDSARRGVPCIISPVSGWGGWRRAGRNGCLRG